MGWRRTSGWERGWWRRLWLKQTRVGGRGVWGSVSLRVASGTVDRRLGSLGLGESMSLGTFCPPGLWWLPVRLTFRCRRVSVTVNHSKETAPRTDGSCGQNSEVQGRGLSGSDKPSEQILKLIASSFHFPSLFFPLAPLRPLPQPPAGTHLLKFLLE